MKKRFKELTKEVEKGVYGNRINIGRVGYHVISKNDYSFHLYVIEDTDNGQIRNELKYDLRNREYYIIREGRNVSFNQQNLDRLVPREKLGARRFIRNREKNMFDTSEGTNEFFSLITVESNRDMYKELVRAIGSLGEEILSMPSRALVRLMTEYSKLELIYKGNIPLQVVKNTRIRERIIEASKTNKGKLHQVLGISRAQLTYIREMFGQNVRKDFSIARKIVNRIEILQDVPVKNFNEYLEDVKLIEKLEEEYNLEGRLNTFNSDGLWDLKEAVIEDNRRKNGRTYSFRRGFYSFVMEFKHPNKRRLIEYLLFECLVSQGMEFNEAFYQYEDYYRMSKELENERFDMYPKYLKTYHDIVSRNFNSLRDEITNKKFSEVTQGYKELEHALKDYVVITPKTPKDLITEGNSLNHCIPSYISRVAEGGTQIVLLRDKEDIEKSLITVEIRGDEIVQARGFSNRLPDEEERGAIKEYAKYKELEVSLNI